MYNVVLVSGTQQRLSVIHIHVFILFQILFFYSLFIFGSAGSSWLHGIFSTFSEQGLLSSCAAQASHCGRFSSCRTQAPGRAGFGSHSTQAQHLRLPGFERVPPELWYTGLAAAQHIGSSQPRDWTCVSYIGRRILYHWVSREALFFRSFSM